MAKTFHLIDQQNFGESGIDAEIFATFESEHNFSNGAILTNIEGCDDKMYGIMQSITDVDTGEIRLVVGEVKFGRVSNIATPDGRAPIIR